MSTYSKPTLLVKITGFDGINVMRELSSYIYAIPVREASTSRNGIAHRVDAHITHLRDDNYRVALDTLVEGLPRNVVYVCVEGLPNAITTIVNYYNRAAKAWLNLYLADQRNTEEEKVTTIIEPKIVVRARDDIKEEIRETLSACNLKITEIATDMVHGFPYLLVYVRPDAGKTRSVKLYGCDGRVIRWATPTTVVASSGEVASFIIGHYRSLELICNAISTNEPEEKEMDEEIPKKFTIAAVSRDSRAVDLLRAELPDGVLVKSVHRQEDRAEQNWDAYIDIVHFGNTEVSAYFDRKYEDELIEDEYLTATASCPRLLAQKLAEQIRNYLPEDLLWKQDSREEKPSDSSEDEDNRWYVVAPKVKSKLGSAVRTMPGWYDKCLWANTLMNEGEKIGGKLVSFTKDEGGVHVLVHFNGKVDYTLCQGENPIDNAISWFSDKYLNRV